MKAMAWVAVLGMCGFVSLTAEAQECTDDGDCDEGYTCQVVGESSSGCDPDPNGECPEPVITEYRECEPAPLTCNTDADCPSDLSCVAQEVGCAVAAGGPGGSSGEESCDEPPEEKLCAWELVECQSDSDCAANEECIPTGAETCSSPPPCAGGDACSDEPICEPASDANVCFPKQVACDDDADCAKGEVCYDLGELADDLPPTWEDLGTLYCFTEGLALVFDGRADVSGASLEGGGSKSSAESGSGAQSDQDEATPTRASGDSSKEDAGGCAVARFRPSGALGSVGLLLFGLALGARRFRRE